MTSEALPAVAFLSNAGNQISQPRAGGRHVV